MESSLASLVVTLDVFQKDTYVHGRTDGLAHGLTHGLRHGLRHGFFHI